MKGLTREIAGRFSRRNRKRLGRQLALAAVNRVSDQPMPCMGHMDPDLMGASGFQPAFDQSQPRRCSIAFDNPRTRYCVATPMKQNSLFEINVVRALEVFAAVVETRHVTQAAAMLGITRNTGQLSGVAVLGALWAMRVSHHTGRTIDAQEAPAFAQAAALRDVGWMITALMLVALALSIWGLAEERRGTVGVGNPADQ